MISFILPWMSFVNNYNEGCVCMCQNVCAVCTLHTVFSLGWMFYINVVFPVFLLWGYSVKCPHSYSKTGLPVCICVFLYLTLTKSSGNCPREFSGTLIGGMTQSLFTRFIVPSPLTTTLRHGNKISGTRWVSVASLGFTCGDSKQILCSGPHTHTNTHRAWLSCRATLATCYFLPQSSGLD